jgi:L-aminopeptidase/D-esterase-like protein
MTGGPALFPEGFTIGHWEDSDALTGCTVILCPPGTVGGCDVRGSSPGSRELALLASDKKMETVNAVLLTGGTAFGLAAADGVMRFLENRGIGYQTPWGYVPIVPAAVIFDLNVGRSTVRPGPEAGHAACESAGADNGKQGCVGAGTGATVGKWAGPEYLMKGGLGISSRAEGSLVVAAVAVVNAVGDVLAPDGSVLAGARMADGSWVAGTSLGRTRFLARQSLKDLGNTTLAVVMTNAVLTKVETNRVAQRGHDGMARAVKPVHTSFDGDIVFALSSGSVAAHPDLVAELGADAVAEAIRNGVVSATPMGGIRACNNEESA